MGGVRELTQIVGIKMQLLEFGQKAVGNPLVFGVAADQPMRGPHGIFNQGRRVVSKRHHCGPPDLELLGVATHFRAAFLDDAPHAGDVLGRIPHLGNDQAIRHLGGRLQ